MWRSLLFIPVLEERFIEKAASRGADAIVLDLEAGVADSRKEEARRAIPVIVKTLEPEIPVTVRINSLWLPAIEDLTACIIPGVQAIHLAQCESVEHIKAVDGVVSELEASRGLSSGSIKLIAMLESAKAVAQAPAIANASTRLAGLTLGVEDYATSMGVSASSDVLDPAAFQVIQAARANRLAPLVVPASMADFRDLEALESAARYARALGSVGGYVVHPAQINILNQVFSPTAEEVRWSQAVIAATEQAKKEGRSVFEVNGQMIDQPLIERAARLLQLSQ
ncbi:MAG: CoA ester lyase [Granulosicoccus sp.]|nr:CoA ester lyase [Granulosicoccus sp.]